MSVTVVAPDIAGLAVFFEQAHDKAEMAAVMSLNQIAERDAMKAFRSDIMEQVNFKKGYLKGDRLEVSKKASKGDLEAVISGRDRPTSLYTFAKFKKERTKNGKSIERLQSVTVKPGSPQTMQGAFLKKLNNDNKGLAIRVKEGDTLRNSRAAIRIAENLYLLYGPSVDQVLGSIADKNTSDLATKLSNEFMRQYLRLLGND